MSTSSEKSVATKFRGAESLILAADVWGNPDAPAVLLAHGGGQTRRAWDKAAAVLAANGWRAVALDLRGHGESEWSPSGDYSIETFGDDLLAVADQLGGQPSVVGASLGGLAALVAEGETRPGSFATLTLVDIAPRMAPEGVAKIVGFMGAHVEIGFDSVEAAADVIASYTPRRRRPTDLSGLAKNLRQDEHGRWRWHWDPAFIKNVSQTRGERRDERLDEAAERLQLPVHLIRGRSSELISEECAQHFLSLVPHARFTDVAGAGHMVAGDRNDAFVEAVLQFLGQWKAGR